MAISFLEKLAIKDANATADLFENDIEWNVGVNRKLPWAGRRSKEKEVAEYFNTMWPYFEDGKNNITVEKSITSGNDKVIAAIFTHTAAGTGQSFTTRLLYTVVLPAERLTGCIFTGIRGLLARRSSRKSISGTTTCFQYRFY